MIEYNVSLLPYNTFGIEAEASVLMKYGSEDELQACLGRIHARFHGMPVLHIGGGSNLLFLKDFDGVVLFSELQGIELLEETDRQVRVRVGGGMVHDDWVAFAVAKGWHGLENLSLIPGQVGASAVQNIGAYGVEACDVIESVEGVSLRTGERRVWQCQECQYGYRNSIFKGELRGQYAITYVTYRLSRTFLPRLDYGGLRSALEQRGISAETVAASQVRDLITDIRRQKLPDPRMLGNAGSFFMNPVVGNGVYARIKKTYPDAPCYRVDESHVKVPAGWLIEKAGWKGRQLGPAAVHDRQALVLVNKGGATGGDILRLCDAVRGAVMEKFGIDLHPEVNFI